MLNVSTTPRLHTAPMPKFGSVDFGNDGLGTYIKISQDLPGEVCDVSYLGDSLSDDQNLSGMKGMAGLLSDARSVTALALNPRENAAQILAYLGEMLDSDVMLFVLSDDTQAFENLLDLSPEVDEDGSLLFSAEEFDEARY